PLHHDLHHHRCPRLDSGRVSVSPLDFTGSDAVFYIPPPPFHSGDVDLVEFATNAANNVKDAIEKAGSVRRLLVFSALGAENDHGIGILKINNISDKIFKTAAPEVAIIKPGYFAENWTAAFETAKAEPPVLYSPLTPLMLTVSQVSLIDIRETCARILLDLAAPLPRRTHAFELYGPRHYSTEDVRDAVQEITGKKVGIVAIEVDELAGFYAQEGIPAGLVLEMVEFTTAALPGGIMDGRFGGDKDTVWGKVELVDALRKVYKA
ncbi:NAD(P)H azoreductase, partial [Colletotrichum asianum]